MSKETEMKKVSTVVTDDTTQVEVEHWDSPRYGGDNVRAGGVPFTMELVDHRALTGQMLLNIAPVEGDLDDILSVAAEVSSAPGSNDAVQALSLYVDSDNVALRFFKQDDQVLIVPGDPSVRIYPTRLPDGGTGWIVR